MGINQWSRALGRQLQPQQAECLSGDSNVILLSANVQYQIEDVHRYLFGTANVPVTLAGDSSSRVMSEIARPPEWKAVSPTKCVPTELLQFRS